MKSTAIEADALDVEPANAVLSDAAIELLASLLIEAAEKEIAESQSPHRTAAGV